VLGSKEYAIRGRSATGLRHSQVIGANSRGKSIPLAIDYPYRVVYMRVIGTHRRYDAIDAQTI